MNYLQQCRPALHPTVAVISSGYLAHRRSLLRRKVRRETIGQTPPEVIEVKLFCTAPPSAAQLQALEEVICTTLGHPFVIRFTLLDQRVPLGASGKFEEFMCLI